jgi:putative Holliday junction resolvase
MKRAISFDFGHARIGVSVSDPLQCIASPLAVLTGNKDPARAARNVANELPKILKERNFEIDRMVVGLPLHLNGTESERSQEVKVFAASLESFFHLPIHFFDERLTSLQAERAMKEGSLSRKKRSMFVDEIASTILLQSFLDFQSSKSL